MNVSKKKLFDFLMAQYCMEIKKPEEPLTFEHTEQARIFALKVIRFLEENNFIDSEKPNKA